MTPALTVRNIVEDLKLKVLAGEQGLDLPVTVDDLKRPGLPLAGYFDYFPAERVQIMGLAEITFLESLPLDLRRERLNRLFAYPELPAVVCSRNLTGPPELKETAARFGKPLLQTPLNTTKFISLLTTYLEEKLAPRETVHGSLVLIYGVGVLLTGPSGIGKSETALELIKRGHRLVADDVVEIHRAADGLLVGVAPDLTRYMLEVRGIGLLNIRTLFGAAAVRDNASVELAVSLTPWVEGEMYDRLGLEENKTTYCEVDIPKIILPVAPGRNLAVILEVAAMNFRLKDMGVNSALEFVEKMRMAMKK